MNERTFNPDKARQIGGHGVENVPLSNDAVKGNIGSSLQNLGGILKGAEPRDYDEIFEGLPVPLLEHYKDVAEQISDNLKRIIERRNPARGE